MTQPDLSVATTPADDAFTLNPEIAKVKFK